MAEVCVIFKALCVVFWVLFITAFAFSHWQLWALLHFIMPTLFDSHEEFNEWFSKDIENHAENKTAIDQGIA